mmetsp:Transcript_24050/g.35279  ORF Transcript_24050/g.35279 Transcript_24050/m.35279 type:complete len:149 (+) Transcript_24050:111-557(+)
MLPAIPSLLTQSTQDLSASLLSPSDFPRTPPHLEFHDNTHHHSELFHDNANQSTSQRTPQYSEEVPEPEAHHDTTQTNYDEPYVMQTTERCDSMSTFGMKSNIIRNADIFRQQANNRITSKCGDSSPQEKDAYSDNENSCPSGCFSKT